MDTLPFIVETDRVPTMSDVPTRTMNSGEGYRLANKT